MKNYKQILEAVNRGIQLALDDFNDDEEQIQNIKSKQINHRDYTKEYLDLMNEVVDLGLPSGTLWCKYNLGAKCEPNNNKSWFGDYYAWGELEPNKGRYDWNHYKFYNGPDIKNDEDIYKFQIENYINKYGMNDKTEDLQLEDDAAYQFKKLHNFKFHIPTIEQAQELLDNVKRIYVDEVNNDSDYKDAQGYTGAGWFMISKINGNYLFFPRSGIKEGGGLSADKIESGIWTSHVSGGSYASKTNCATAIRLYPQFHQENRHLYSFWKYEGMVIRPVINLR